MYIRFNGFEAGGYGPLRVEDMPSPEDDIVTSRTDVLGGDGQVAGNDYLRKSVWNIGLLVNTFSYEDGMAMVRKVRDAWQDPKVRFGDTPAPLDYSKDGQTWYRVYGRPVNYGGPPQGTSLDQGVAHIELQFEQLRAAHYSQPQSEILVPTAAAFQGGWVAPFVFPLVATGTSVPSSVAIDNKGTEPAPIRVTFFGPSSNPRAWAGSVEVQYRGSLAHDEWVTIDGMGLSVKLGGGGRAEPIDVSGRLSPHTLLSELGVPPGRTDWWYEAIDEAAQSKAEFTWWDAYQSMQ